MSNEEEIEELKRLIEEERTTERERNKRNHKTWYDKHYKNKKQDIQRGRRLRRQKLKAELVAIKGGKCEECHGVFPPWAYDFHHVAGKDMNTGSFLALSNADMIEELNKCVLLCAICHRGKHLTDQEW